MIFFTGCTHWGHGSVIKFTNRPFKDVDEMDAGLTKNWNDVVMPGDTVYHLGDFSWGNVAHYREQLNGNIVLIIGNHDKEAKSYKGFQGRERYHELKWTKSDGEKVLITMCHYAMRVWNRSHYNQWSIYSHSHGRLPPVGKSWDVGVDANDYTPVSIYELEVIMNTRPDNFNLVRKNGT